MRLLTLITMASAEVGFDVGKVDFGGVSDFGLISVKSLLEIRFSIWMHICRGNLTAVTMALSEFRFDIGKVDFAECLILLRALGVTLTVFPVSV